jgi:hypothetical protein
MADLGDISGFLQDGNVSNLDWLDVDEAEYRKTETLPKQNLDIAPDLQAVWDREDGSGAKLVPNRAQEPRTVGDLSAQHGLLRAKPEDIRKVARLTLMQSDNLARFQDALVKRFDIDSLRVARTVLASTLAERGLLGRLYIDASDFPTCASGASQPIDFVKRYASDAKFVLAKTACSGCVHSHGNPTGGQNCAVFHKEIKVEVPFTPALAEQVEKAQTAKGKQLVATSQDLRERIRLAMLAPDAEFQSAALPRPKEQVLRLLRPVEATPQVTLPVDLTRPKQAAREAVDAALRGGRLTVPNAQALFRGIAAATTIEAVEDCHKYASEGALPARKVYAGPGEQPPPVFVPPDRAEAEIAKASAEAEKQAADAKAVVAAERARPVLALLRREMLKGRSEDEVRQALASAFQSTDLEATAPSWVLLASTMGAYGVVYATQSSFDDCHEGADFLAKHNPGIRYMVAGQKCAGCIYNKIGRCLIYGKPLVASPVEVVTPEIVQQVLADHKSAGRIAPWDNRSWGESPSQALRNIHAAAAATGLPQRAQPRLEVVKGYYATAPQVTTGELTRREIVKTARQYMNEGLYGSDLLQLLQSKFDKRDLVAAAGDIRPVIAEQGLQGIFYVDPEVYDDYGKGCDKAASLHRSRGVPYLKVGSKCGSCVLQTRPGFCSKLNKPLVVEPPYVDKAAQQREILASGASTEMDVSNLVNNGHAMMAEFEVQQKGMDIELDPVVTVAPFDISFK